MKGGTLERLKKRALQGILEKLEHGIVIVEGKHDVETLRKLGISSIAYANFIAGNINTTLLNTGMMFYVMMDADKGGEDKREKVVLLLSGMDNGIDYDTETGRRFLKMLGITSVEQAYGRVTQVMNEYRD